MKKLMLAVLALSLLNSCYGTKKADLKSDKGKTGYTIGYNIGTELKGQGLDVDIESVFVGLSDAYTAKAEQLTSEERMKVLHTLQTTMREAQQKQMEEKMMADPEKKAEAEANLGTATEFLEKNKTERDVKVTDSGLQYLVIKEGSGKLPGPTDTVEVHYKGTLLDGSEYDSSYKSGKPAQFPVNQVIKGWTEALQKMKVGAKWKLFVPPALAYGKMGRPSIPANSLLVFEVELLNIK